MSRLRVITRGTAKLPRDSGGLESRKVHGNANPFTDVNRISSKLGRAYHTKKVGDLVPRYFPCSHSVITVYAIENNQSLGLDSRHCDTYIATESENDLCNLMFVAWYCDW